MAGEAESERSALHFGFAFEDVIDVLLHMRDICPTPPVDSERMKWELWRGWEAGFPNICFSNRIHKFPPIQAKTHKSAGAAWTQNEQKRRISRGCQTLFLLRFPEPITNRDFILNPVC